MLRQTFPDEIDYFDGLIKVRWARSGRILSPGLDRDNNFLAYNERAIANDNQRNEEIRKKKISEILNYIDGLLALDPSRLNDSEAHLDSNSVFLVHGHNEEIFRQTAQFLVGHGLDVVVLHEQPNLGRTIIEKFVDYSDVAFAVVLLTADDRGGMASTSFKDQSPRARQNVILELGFFLGKLGRNRVFALYEEGVEIPSDYSGVLFTALDKQNVWQSELLKELKAASLLRHE